jgi:hypothetical protein
MRIHHMKPTVDNGFFEKVIKFKYFQTTLISGNYINEELTTRLNVVNFYFNFSYQKPND